jgi:hypothetical protein
MVKEKILLPWIQPQERPFYLEHDQRNNFSPFSTTKKMTLFLLGMTKGMTSSLLNMTKKIIFLP